jgi:hypothetical protein
VDIRFDRYEMIQDADTRRVRLWFVSPNPEPQGPDGIMYSDLSIQLTDAQITTLAAITGWSYNTTGNNPTTVQINAFWSLVNTELARTYRANGIANRIRAMIGQTETV